MGPVEGHLILDREVLGRGLPLGLVPGLAPVDPEGAVVDTGAPTIAPAAELVVVVGVAVVPDAAL